MANFGFDEEPKRKDFERRSPNHGDPTRCQVMPIQNLDLDYTTELMSRQMIGEKVARRPFMDKVVWGNDVGAVRLNIGTKTEMMVDKLCTDLQGVPVWVTKRMVQLERQDCADQEMVIADEIMQEIKDVDQSPLDSPTNQFDKFERLVTAIAYKAGTVANDPLFIDGITKLNDNRYIIVFGVRGAGTGNTDQSRVNQVMIDMSFDQETGVIKMIEGNVESAHKKGMEWNLVPSDFILNFMPSQPQDEIVDICASVIKFF